MRNIIANINEPVGKILTLKTDLSTIVGECIGEYNGLYIIKDLNENKNIHHHIPPDTKVLRIHN